MSHRLTTEQFITLSKQVHGNKYSYAKTVYGNSNKDRVIITCPDHGDFTPRANDHLSGYGCRKCADRKSSERNTVPFNSFKERAEKKHNSFYSYIESTYINTQEKLTIVCPLHGEFQQAGEKHLMGKGCRECRKVKLAELFKDGRCSSWTRDKWVAKFENKDCIFYVIECTNTLETFIKIGITSTGSISKRYPKQKMPYYYKKVLSITSSAGTIWDLEKRMIGLLKRYAYVPDIKFNGSTTECYKIKALPVIKRNVV